jgi:hypothetical protein
VILRRLILALAAASALAASAGVCVVALAFALYALVKPAVGPAGASGIVAAAAAALIGLGGLVLLLLSRPKRAPKRVKAPLATPAGVAERVMDFLRDKPVIAIAGALVTGLLTVRNPRYLGAAIRSFVEGREHDRR